MPRPTWPGEDASGMWPVTSCNWVQGVPGARAWRRRLSEGAMAHGAGLEVLCQAAEALGRHGY